MTRRAVAALIVILTSAATVAQAATLPRKKCDAAIRKSAGAIALATLRALAKCEHDVLIRKLPDSLPCAQDRKARAALDKARAKAASAIAKACGGKDKLCGSPDDVGLVDLGWDLGTCPAVDDCANPIVSCADISTCLGCVIEHASTATLDLVYADTTGDPTASGVRRCRLAIGKATTLYASQRRKRLAECWATHATLASGSLCPTNIAERDIAKDRAHFTRAVCKACGAKSGCDNLSATAMEFPAACPDVTPPGGISCARPVATLADVSECLACVTDYHVDCADRAAVPGFVHFPAECNAPPVP